MSNVASASVAYGHLRNAAWHYLSTDDDGGEGVFLGAACLDVEDSFEKAEVIPEVVEDAGSAEAAIKAALASLEKGCGPLVPALRDALVDLAVRAGVRPPRSLACSTGCTPRRSRSPISPPCRRRTGGGHSPSCGRGLRWPRCGR